MKTAKSVVFLVQRQRNIYTAFVTRQVNQTPSVYELDNDNDSSITNSTHMGSAPTKCDTLFCLILSPLNIRYSIKRNICSDESVNWKRLLSRVNHTTCWINLQQSDKIINNNINPSPLFRPNSSLRQPHHLLADIFLKCRMSFYVSVSWNCGFYLNFYSITKSNTRSFY